MFYLGLFREKVSLQPVEYVRGPDSCLLESCYTDSKAHHHQYQKLPPTPTVETLYLLDPLIATGGTAVAAISILVSGGDRYHSSRRTRTDVCARPQLDWGLEISQIKVLSILGSKPGLTRVAEAYPGLEIYTCGIDDVVRDTSVALSSFDQG